MDTNLFEKNEKNKNNDSYSAKDIEVLEGLEPVRLRPGMYIGGTDERALHHMVAEVLDNSMDEAVAGHADLITVSLDKDGIITITDNGRGIPVDSHPKYKNKSALEVILTTLHSGGKFSNKAYQTSGGLHGVGISVVNALSDHLEVNVKRDGKTWQQKYSKGTPLTKLSEVKSSKGTGTSISFHPDPQIFGNVQFNVRILHQMARSKAYLHRGIKITWQCAENKKKDSIPTEDEFHFPNGLLDFLEQTVKLDKSITPEPFHGTVEIKEHKAKIEWAICWQPGYEEFIRSYCNTVPTSQGGTHESGFKQAIVKGLKDFGDLSKNKKVGKITADDVLKGATAILSVFITDPQFQGQTKEKLSNTYVTRMVENAIKDHFDHWLSGNPNIAGALLDSIVEAAEERQRLRQAREASRKSATQRLRLPGKLADCSQKTAEGTEIFFVEGDSAGGTAKQARDRATQAVMPLRGKVLNVASASFDKLQANQELKDLEQALGCGRRDAYDESKLRYDRIIIMTDADVDGAHIASLLMTFFFLEMRQLIENGHLYLAQPPLYKVSQSGKTFYVNSDAEKDAIVKKEFKVGAKYDVSRFKGLGEMNAPQLKETTMNKETRLLAQVSLKDAENMIDKTLEKFVTELMGKKPEYRFKFIQDNAKFVDDLDI
jgi:topoisomerase-4 subunit B